MNKFLRKCVGCRTSKKKEELIRFVKTNDSFIMDCEGNAPGRGYYVCKDSESCMKKAEKQFERGLK